MQQTLRGSATLLCLQTYLTRVAELLHLVMDLQLPVPPPDVIHGALWSEMAHYRVHLVNYYTM
jgi:hypothetical protein